MPSTGQPDEKISFIRSFPEWGWIIGTGFYKAETENYLAKREHNIAQQNQSQLVNLLGLSLVTTLFFVALSLLLTQYLTRRFSLYENKITHDFEELNTVKMQLQHQALHDSLTQLPNRILLNEQISAGIELSKASNKNLAVMFVDLDDFKKINDLHGHSIGDKLLEVLGKEFSQIVKGHDSVARFGGDEFIFCFPLITDLKDAQEKVTSIQQIFNKEFIIKGKSIFSSCSIGVAMYPDDSDITEDLISKADIVLYKSKSIEKGCSLFFNDVINKQVKRDFLIEAELRIALSENELSVFYQPQICVETGKIQGVEALVRWSNKILGNVSPTEFIKLAEDIGIISDIGHFVINKALKDIKQFNDTHTYDLQLSINISPKELMDTNFVDRTLNSINEIAFNPHLVTLEVTENVLISDLNKVTPILKQLRDHGIKFSLDDFGTGYSSLSYLGNLPMNEIKIDRSFIEKLLVNKQSESLVKTIIAIGQFYNLSVVAEGVETKEQYERLALFNCDLIQGYYFDKPLALSNLIDKYQTG
jgi:diguanylate cyclase (GGDEF)-like protein